MGLISHFGSTYTVKRFDPGEYIDGHYIEGVESLFEIIASIQPLSSYEMLQLPEGQRTKEAVKVYTPTGLRQTIESQQVKGDRISYKGRLYEVQKVSTWETFTDIPHFKAVAVMVEVD